MSESPNTFGHLFRMTAFGESQSLAMGVIVEGCPAGVHWKKDILSDFLRRRRPGGALVTERREQDIPEILSGVHEGKTLGTPIALIVRNSFGRETLPRVMAGAVAKNFVQQIHPKLGVFSKTLQVGTLAHSEENFIAKLEQLLSNAKEYGKSYGGIAEIKIQNPPEAMDESIFIKLKSELAGAMMSVSAVLGVELGNAFDIVANEAAKIQGNPQKAGEEIFLRVAVKPATPLLDVVKAGKHDPCVLLNALIVFEAMAWLVIADQLLYRKLNKV